MWAAQLDPACAALRPHLCGITVQACGCQLGVGVYAHSFGAAPWMRVCDSLLKHSTVLQPSTHAAATTAGTCAHCATSLGADRLNESPVDGTNNVSDGGACAPVPVRAATSTATALASADAAGGGSIVTVACVALVPTRNSLPRYPTPCAVSAVAGAGGACGDNVSTLGAVPAPATGA